LRAYLVVWRDHKDFVVEAERVVTICADEGTTVMFLGEDEKLLYALPKEHVDYEEVKEN